MKFENLEVWKRSSILSVLIYKELADLKDYGFKDQITRSGLSVPSNIAEGFGRSSDKEKRNFLNLCPQEMPLGCQRVMCRDAYTNLYRHQNRIH